MALIDTDYLNEFDKAVASYKILWEKQQDQDSNYSFPVPDASIKSLFNFWVEKQPDKPFIIYEDKIYTYKQCDNIARRFANGIKNLGYKKGERLITFMQNGPEFIFICLACFKLGVIIVNCNPLDTPREYAFKLYDSGAKIAVADETSMQTLTEAVTLMDEPLKHIIIYNNDNENLSMIKGMEVIDYYRLIEENHDTEPEVKVLPGDIQVLQYTGGTTGILKGCSLTNRCLTANALATVNHLEGAVKREEFLIIIPVPMSHGMGFNCGIMLPIAAGGTSILINMRNFNMNNLIDVIARTRPAIWPTVPTVLKKMIENPPKKKYDISSIKAVVCSSAPLAMETIKKFESLSNAKITETYGLSEACTSVLSMPFNTRKQGTVGIPYPNTEVLIVDIESGTRVMNPGERGEIIFRGPQMMKEYWNKPEETKATIRNGWLYTGDIGIMDEEGVFRIVDRIKDVIFVGGLNVYPREVDEVLYAHPDIIEACTIGIPDEKRGEVPIAFVVKRAESGITEEDIIDYCRTQLSRFKVPKKIEFVDMLPKTNNNKIDRKTMIQDSLHKMGVQRLG